MHSIENDLREWIRETNERHITKWDDLPDIELYMDQIITYLDRQFEPYKTEKKEKIITPSMINNYVKDGILPRPDGKKYGRTHMARLIEICMFKQVLSISEIKALFATSDTESVTSHNNFCSLHDEVIAAIGQQLTEQLASTDRDELRSKALRLVIESSVKRVAAVKILELLSAPSDNSYLKHTN